MMEGSMLVILQLLCTSVNLPSLKLYNVIFANHDDLCHCYL